MPIKRPPCSLDFNTADSEIDRKEVAGRHMVAGRTADIADSAVSIGTNSDCSAADTVDWYIPDSYLAGNMDCFVPAVHSVQRCFEAPAYSISAGNSDQNSG